MQVNAKVPESQIDKLTRNMKARIRVDAFASETLDGTVIEVATLPDATSFFSSDIKVYTAKVRIDKPLSGLRPGMTARGRDPGYRARQRAQRASRCHRTLQ